MTKGRRISDLPDYAEVDGDSRVRCTLCVQYNKRDYRANWVLRASFATHGKQPCHLKSVEAQRSELLEKASRSQTFVTAQPIQTVPEHLEDTSEILRSIAEEEMYTNFDGNFSLDPGQQELHEEARRTFNEASSVYGDWDGTEALPDDVGNLQDWLDEHDNNHLLDDLLHETDDSDEDWSLPRNNEAESAAWSPYPSKLAFLLHTISNLPRLRISSSFMKVILWLLKEIGVKDVPSFYGFEKLQKKLKEEKVVPTIQWKSPRGNVFSFNDPRALIANDWSNPLVAKHIRRYPVIPQDGIISEVWHAQKWRHDLERHCMSPMYDAGNGQHYFIDEPASLKGGKLVIPVRWLENEKGEVFFDAWEVKVNEQGLSTIHDEQVILVAASSLEQNMLGLEGLNNMPLWCPTTVAKGHAHRMPNPDRALAQGDPIYCCFIDVFGDDVSGNRSKSWNKHWNVYFTNRNLPRQLLQQQSNIHFLSTSTHAPVPEQFQGIKKIIETTHTQPIKTRCATNGQVTRVKIHCNCCPGDNPSQSETCGHIGSQGNFPCRKCHVGGSQKQKETDAGFESLFAPAHPRSSNEILKEVEMQVEIAFLGVAQTVKDRQTDTGVKDSYTQPWIEELILRSREMQKQKKTLPTIQAELKEWVSKNRDAVFNPFLTLKGFDVAQDTPVEILHTILLGVVKYSWYGSHSQWNDTTKKTYSSRLQASNVNGLSIPPIRAGYIMQYANSLIGRQLKTLVQVNAFHVYDLVGDLQFRLTKATGELSVLLWFPEIKNLDEYLADVEMAAANVLDIAAELDPSKIIAKIKNHLLAHIRADILRFGPIVGVATETFECFNAIFRFCSILSNHLAPSRDIALQLAEQEVVKHFLSGGHWLSTDDSWKQSGHAVKEYLGRHSFLQALLGYGHPSEDKPAGTVTLEPLKRTVTRKRIQRPILKLQDTQAAAANIPTEMRQKTDAWHQGKKIISLAQDDCVVGSWIYAKNPFDPIEGAPISGRIVEILQEAEGNMAYVIIDVFRVLADRHLTFGMPVMVRRYDEKVLQGISANTVLFEFNAQHDCRDAGCSASGVRKVPQERIQSDTVEEFVEHKPLDRYIMNTHGFHNAHLLRRVLPRTLTSPVPYAVDRAIHHATIATSLRDSQDGKRLKTAEKRKATAAAKRKADEDAGGATGSQGKRQRQATAVESVASGSGLPEHDFIC